MKKTWFAALLLCLLIPALAAASGEKLKSGVFDPPRAAPEIGSTGSDGKPFKLSRYLGKVVVLGFGFTSCTEVCPTTLAELAGAKKQLGKAGKGVQIVYVTVDPERDDPSRLAKYLDAFDPSFVGVTGTPKQMKTVRDAYGITAEKKASADGSYTVHHSAFLYLIDRAGRLRALSPYGRKTEDLVHDLRLLLEEPA